MNGNTSNWPNAVWDGTSPTRSNHHTTRKPDGEDFDQAITEIRALQSGGGVDARAVAGTGVTLEAGAAPVRKLVLNIDNEVAIVDADTNGAHGSMLLVDFTNEDVTLLRVEVDVALALDPDAAIDDDAAGAMAIGSAVPGTDNATLTSTEADIFPSTALTFAGDAETVAAAVQAAPAIIDDEVYLNFALAAADVAAGGGTIGVTGTVTLYYF